MRNPEPSRGSPELEDREPPSILDDVVEASAGPEPKGAAPAQFVATCVDARHPTLAGRVLAEWREDGRKARAWLPALHGLSIRERDRILCARPANWAEPIVTGVVDGFAERPEIPKKAGPSLALERDEAVRIEAADGNPLIEVFQGEKGPVVRLLDEDVHLDLEGRLRVDARSIVLAAKSGSIEIEANDDVEVKGREIRLN